MNLPPPSISHPLIVYLADDHSIWAVNAADGSGYQIQVPVGTPTSGVAEAPADGGTYGRQDNQWTQIPQIPTAQLVITTIQPASALESTSVLITVNGTGFTPTSIVSWGGFPLVTTFIDNKTLQATINLGPGSSGIYTVVVTDGNALSNSVAFTVTPAAGTFTTADASCTLKINEYGDLIATQTQGPNAGKSVNLTYGKWA
jgi:IPT/TIG domain